MLAVSLALALALPANVSVQAATSVSNETNGGWVSVAPGNPSRPTVSTAITPTLGLNLVGRTFSAGVSYNLRLFRRFELSNATNQVATIDRFLVNHSSAANFGLQLQKGWNIGGTVTMSLGEVDLPTANTTLTTITTNAGTGAGTQVGTTTPATVDPAAISDDGVIESINVQGTANLSGTLTPMLDFDLSFRSAYRGPLSTPDNLQGTDLATLVPKQSSYGVNSSFSYSLTRFDKLSLALGATWSLSPRTGDYRSLSMLIGYGRQLGTNTSLSAGLGILSLKVLKFAEVIPGLVLPEDSLSPALNVTFSTRMLNLRDFRVGFSTGSSISSRQNPSTGALEPRLSATMGFSSNIGSRWTVELRAAFATPATTQAAMTASTTTPGTAQVNSLLTLSETTVEVQLPVSYRFDGGVSVASGLIYSNYGPRLANPDFSLDFPGVRVFLRVSLGLTQSL